MLSVKITPDSVGPKHICNECYDRVQDWVMFKRQSEEALKEIECSMNVTDKEVKCVEVINDWSLHFDTFDNKIAVKILNALLSL